MSNKYGRSRPVIKGTKTPIPHTGIRDGRAGITGSNQYGKVHKTKFEMLHERRTVEQLQKLLDERLAELRANPPRGYPV